MKKMFAFLSLLLLPTFVLAEDVGFSATDKVLYFSADVLKDVIKRTFPENLQLNVAQKYVDLMDKNGNMSVDDLMVVCQIGKLDSIACRNFVQDLLVTSGNRDIKPFYWADYIGKGKVLFGKSNSGDGYFNDLKSVGSGGWGIKFDWTANIYENIAFEQMYPASNAIIGTSACTRDAGTAYVPDNTKNYAPNTQTGEHCWCKMTGPEETPWVYLYDVSAAEFNCARGCSQDCLESMYGNTNVHSTNMQKAMFTAVKLNKSIANIADENTIQKGLTAEFIPPAPKKPVAQKPKPKPKKEVKCEFDWTRFITDGLVKDTTYRFENKYPVYYYNNDEGFICKYGKVDFATLESKCELQPYKEYKITLPLVNKEIWYAHETSNDENVKTGYDCSIKAKCFCRMSSPEMSEWVYVYTFYIESYKKLGYIPGIDHQVCYNRVSDVDRQEECDETCDIVCRQINSDALSKIFRQLGVR